MARKKTTGVSGGVSRGQMPHPLVWYIRFREKGSNAEIAKRYFTSAGRIGDIRRNTTFKNITEDATFSENELDKARDHIKRNFTKNSAGATLRDAAYSLARLDEIRAGKTSSRKVRRGKKSSSKSAHSSSTVAGRQPANKDNVTVTATDEQKADKQQKVSEKLKSMGVMPDADAPAPAVPAEKTLLNIRAEFIFVALAVVFLVAFLVFFGGDDTSRQTDDAATVDVAATADNVGQANSRISDSPLPPAAMPSTTGEEATRSMMSSDKKHSSVAGMAEGTGVISTSRRGSMSPAVGEGGQFPADSGNTASDSGQRSEPRTPPSSEKLLPAPAWRWGQIP